MSLRGRSEELQGVDLLDESEVEVLPGEQIVRIPKTEIYSTEQVRKNFNAESIEEMAFSLEEEGQIQPIIVSERDSRGYCIQKGERRWRGAKMSDKITHLDCLVRAPGSIWGQLVENIIREDLTPFEIGMAIEKGKKEHDLDNKAVAKKLGISSSKVSAYLKAIAAPEIVKKAYCEGVIGDVDTINSLRIAHELNSEETEKLLSSGDGISRKQAQNLTKELKNGLRSELSDEGEKNNLDPVSAKKDRKPQTMAKSIRVSVSGQYGVIDMRGNTIEGELMVLLDDASEAVSLSASKIKLIGYHLG